MRDAMMNNVLTKNEGLQNRNVKSDIFSALFRLKAYLKTIMRRSFSFLLYVYILILQLIIIILDKQRCVSKEMATYGYEIQSNIQMA